MNGFVGKDMGLNFRQPFPPVIEVVPDVSTADPSRHRLTRFGQALLACGIGLLALIAYGTSWNIGRSTAERLQFCQVLPEDRQATTNLSTLSLTTSGEAANMLLWNYRLNQELIKQLTVATSRQRLLLNQQIASLTLRLNRQCHLVRYYRIQAGALTVVSTGAAVILVITGLVRMPKGVIEVSRSEQAIGLTSLALLVLTVGYLSLGGQQEQSATNWGYHQKGLELFSLIRGSLANQQMLLPPDRTTTTPAIRPAPPLKNAEDVAELVTRIDAWLLSVEHGTVKLNNGFARQTFDQLFQNQGQTAPANPLVTGP